MRAAAANFDDEALRQAIAYAAVCARRKMLYYSQYYSVK